jgi:hypothetical protein
MARTNDLLIQQASQVAGRASQQQSRCANADHVPTANLQIPAAPPMKSRRIGRATSSHKQIVRHVNNDSPAGLVGNDIEIIGARIEWLIVVASSRDSDTFWSSIVRRIRFLIRPRTAPFRISINRSSSIQLMPGRSTTAA